MSQIVIACSDNSYFENRIIPYLQDGYTIANLTCSDSKIVAILNPPAGRSTIEDTSLLKATLARQAMETLDKEMRSRGIVTTMMYDFGSQAVLNAMNSLELHLLAPWNKGE
jgi:hypothetical protein